MTLCSVGGATCIATGSVMQMSVTCDGVPTLLVQTFSCSHCIHTHIHTYIYAHINCAAGRGMDEGNGGVVIRISIFMYILYLNYCIIAHQLGSTARSGA